MNEMLPYILRPPEVEIGGGPDDAADAVLALIVDVVVDSVVVDSVVVDSVVSDDELAAPVQLALNPV
jgi:hypothetical protein